MALVLAVAMLLTGTFAWSSISQRATNPLEGENYPGGRIHDHFDGENKDVFAENFSDTSIFVRIQLREFMEVNGEIFGYDTANLVNPDIDDPRTWIPHIPSGSVANCDGAGPGQRFHDYVTWTMGGTTAFMPTFNQRRNNAGMGLWTDTSGEAIDWVSSPNMTAVGSPGQTAEWERIVGGVPSGDFNDGSANFWSVGDTAEEILFYTDPVTGLPAQTTTPVVHTAQMTQTPTPGTNNGVITMAQWQARSDADRVGNFWVIDADGWAYWAQEGGLPPQEATSLLLSSISMSEPDGQWFYAIHVIGEFASSSGLGDWWTDSEFGEPSDEAEELLNRADRRHPVVEGITINNGATVDYVNVDTSLTLNGNVFGRYLDHTPGARNVTWQLISGPGNLVVTGPTVVVATSTAAAIYGDVIVVRATSVLDPNFTAEVRIYVLPSETNLRIVDGRYFVANGDNTYREIFPANPPATRLSETFSAGDNLNPADDSTNIGPQFTDNRTIVGPFAPTGIRFIDNGDGTFMYQADDELLGTADDLIVVPNPTLPDFIIGGTFAAITNAAPISVVRGQTLQMTAEVINNGLPVGSPTLQWQIVGTAPTGVSIDAATGILTTTAASVATTVVIQVRCTATPTPWSAAATVTINNPVTVNPGHTFDAGGVTWRVLSTQMGPTGHGSGTDILIISDRVLNVGTQWNPNNNTAGAYNASAIRNTALLNFYNTQTWAHSLALAPGTNIVGSWGVVPSRTEFTVSPGTPAGGVGTLDGAFLLSEADVLNTAFFPTQASRMATNVTGGTASWWLRSTANATAAIRVNTFANVGNNATSNTTLGVRPALLLSALPS